MKVRLATPEDARSISRVYVSSWQDTYRGIIPQSYLNAMTVAAYARVFRRQLMRKEIIGLVAYTPGGEVFGALTGGFSGRRDCVYCAEIFTLYVEQARRRQGAGRSLADGFAAKLRDIGIYTLQVRVLERNPCRRFYERINGLRLSSRQISFAGTRLDELCYGWLDTRMVRTVDHRQL